MAILVLLALVGGVLVTISGLALLIASIDKPEAEGPACHHCGYSLLGLDQGTERCPECWTSIAARRSAHRVGQLRFGFGLLLVVLGGPITVLLLAALF